MDKETGRRGKLVIISAPSGCGKSTIIGKIMERGEVALEFSVSATNRPPRPGEVDGVNYHFLSDERFKDLIAQGAFVEYEQVYPGRYYGTLRSEIVQRIAGGHNVLLDIDVKGGVNVKRQFGADALSIFVAPPALETLRERLKGRGSEGDDEIEQRVSRAEFEMGFAKEYDSVVVNDRLEDAVVGVEMEIKKFLE